MSCENQIEKEDIAKLVEFFDLLHKIDQRVKINKGGEGVKDMNV